MILHYLKVAVRTLLKYRTQNLISVVGLGVCLLCFSVCFYYTRYVGEMNDCFVHHDRIVELGMKRTDGNDFSGTPASLTERLRSVQWDAAEAFTFVVYPHERSYDIEVESEEMLPFDPLLCMEVDSCFHEVFTPRVVAGSWEVASQTPNSVVLVRSVAQRIFGEAAKAIGRRMVTSAKMPYSRKREGIVYTVQAVVEDWPLNNSLCFMEQLDMLVLNDSDGLMQYSRRDEMTGGNTFVLLRAGASLQGLETEVGQRGLRQTMYGEECSLFVSPLGEMFWRYSIAPYFVWVTFSLGVLVLLVGLLNFFHFLTGTFLNRSREHGLRRVLGGGTKQLFGQLFTQAVLVVLVAFLFTFCLIELLSPYLHLTLLDYSFTIDSSVLMGQCAQYLLLVLGCSLLVCLLVALRIRHMSIQAGIRGSVSGKGHHRGRTVLLGIQYFICWIFITLAAALYLQANRTTSTLFGTLTKEEKADILSIPLDYPSMKQADKLVLVERMKQHAGVADYLLSDINYIRGVSGNALFFDPPTEAERKSLSVNLMSVPANFFEFMNMPLVQGTVFHNEHEMVVDKALEDDMLEREHHSLMGQRLYGYEDGYTVSGVCVPFVTDVYGISYGGSYFAGFALLPSDFTQYVGHCYLKCHPGRTAEVRQYVREVLEQALPYTLQPRIGTLLEDLEEMQGLETKLKGVILFLSIVCVVITLLGVYAAITLDTERRRKEVAIRKVNGAGVRQILLLFARSYLWILGVTAVLAFPLLYVVLEQWKQMYTIFFDDGLFFWLGIFVFVSVVTALTVIFRMLHVAHVNPAEVVKSE